MADRNRIWVQKNHQLNPPTLLCEMTIESIGKSFVTFFQRNHALVSKAKLLL